MAKKKQRLLVTATDGREYECIEFHPWSDFVLARPFGNDEAGFNWRLYKSQIVTTYELED